MEINIMFTPLYYDNYGTTQTLEDGHWSVFYNKTRRVYKKRNSTIHINYQIRFTVFK